MGENKTQPTDADVGAFLDAVEPERRRRDAHRLDAIFREVTGFEPLLWGASIVGYGRYAYRYDSGHSGECLATGFAPRKANLVIYIMPGYADFGDILADLGPCRMGKSCLYLPSLEKVEERALKRLIRAGLEDLGTRWEVRPT